MPMQPATREVVYGNIPNILTSPIRAEDLKDMYCFKHDNGDSIFREEFEELKDWARHWQWKFSRAEKSDVKDLNRFASISPADDHRVILSRKPDSPNSDYINASYIDGYHKARKFIATQGPKPNTVDDFWTLIWEDEVEVIVMLTNVTEEGQCRAVVQYHFIAWPENGVPKTISDLLKLRQSLRSEFDNSEGPIVVHCSDGAGRTGTFIAFVNLMEELLDTQSVDVRAEICRMRHKRTEMVSTATQYVFLHKMMVEVNASMNLFNYENESFNDSASRPEPNYTNFDKGYEIPSTSRDTPDERIYIYD